jgi:hypothetical protein
LAADAERFADARPGAVGLARASDALVLMGSVAAAVTRHTERSVLIVHGRSDDAG